MVDLWIDLWSCALATLLLSFNRQSEIPVTCAGVTEPNDPVVAPPAALSCSHRMSSLITAVRNSTLEPLG